MFPTKLKTASLWLLFLSGVLVAHAVPAQHHEDCVNKTFTDSLIEVYSTKAWEFGYNHPQWQASWDSLLLVCPNVAFAFREKAIPHIKNGNYSKAFEYVGKAVELDPVSWLSYRGFLHCIFTKNYDLALQDFSAADSLAPGGYVMDHTHEFYRALCFLGMKAYGLALTHLNADLETQTKGNEHFNSYLYGGIIQLLSGNYLMAKEMLNKCLGIYPQSPEANYYLAQVYYQLGERSQGDVSMEAAKRFFGEGYRLNEANEFYVNYPLQITNSDLGLAPPTSIEVR